MAAGPARGAIRHGQIILWNFGFMIHRHKVFKQSGAMDLEIAIRLLMACAAASALWALPAAAVADTIYALNVYGDLYEYNGAGTELATFIGPPGTGLSGADGIVVSGDNLFVNQQQAGPGGGGVGEYQFNPGGGPGSGITAVNTNLIPGIARALCGGIALFNGNLLVANQTSRTLGEYSLNGTPIDAPLLTGLSSPQALAVSGADIFVGNYGPSMSVGEYTTSGEVVNASLITGLQNVQSIAVSGSDLFILNGTNIDNLVVSEYDTSGNVINASLITGLASVYSIAIADGNLLAPSKTSVAEYDLSGNLINASFAPGYLDDQLFVVLSPEPSTWVLLAIGAAGLLAFGRRKRPRQNALHA
jgi:PEP-CTERM motif